MLLIHCPHCGPRDEIEFHAGGEAERVRPADPSALSDEEWGDFLFMRRNLKGPQTERWYHFAGCRHWFVLTRDSHTHARAAMEDAAAPHGGGAA